MDDATTVALVATDKPERYIKQLAAHLGRKTGVREDETGTTLTFADGTCRMSCQIDGLLLQASAPTAEGLQHVTGVVARHLVRFGTRDGLEVSWN